MARARTAKHPQAAPPPENEDESQVIPEAQSERAPGNRPGISKAEAVRQALSQGLDSLDDIEDFLKRRHGITMPRPQISAYKAQARKRAGGGDSTSKARRGRKPKAAEPGHAALSQAPRPGTEGDMVDDLAAVKHLVQRLGAEQVRRIVSLFE